jgi:hypothetical protein
MSIFSLTCPDVGCYQNFQCDPEFQNKIVAVAYVRKSDALTAQEKSTANNWIAALYDRYLNAEAYLVFNTSGEKPKPETATTAGRGMQNTKALAKNHTLTYQDMQGVVQNNVQFYNDILSTSQNFDFYYFTPGRIWDASGYYVTVIGDPIITAELNTYQMAEVTVNWVSKVNALPYEFDTDTFLEGLYYIISYTGSSGSTYVGNTITSACTDQQSVTFSAVLNIGAISGAPEQVWSIEESEDSDDITDIGLVINPETGVLTWNPATFTGTYIFTVTVTNEKGCVFGQEIITLIVDCPEEG